MSALESQTIKIFLDNWESSVKIILSQTFSTLDDSSGSMFTQGISSSSDKYSKLTKFACGSKQIVQFYAATNGLMLFDEYGDLGRRIYRIEEIDYYSNTEPGAADAWIDGESVGGSAYEVSDAEYFIYGQDQSPLSIRSEYLETAVSLSDGYADSSLLINPVIVSDKGEPEIWYFASYLPGAVRFRCFYDYLLWERERNLKSLSQAIG